MFINSLLIVFGVMTFIILVAPALIQAECDRTEPHPKEHEK